MITAWFDRIHWQPFVKRAHIKTESTNMSELSQAQAQLEQAKAELEFAIKQAGESASPDEKIKKPNPERAVDSMFRSAYRVQMDLTALADNKANMMISINGIVMSIIIASVAPKLDNNPWLLLPTVVLLIGNMVSMVYAVMAARPRVKSPALNPPIPAKPGGNILFFGTFANMREDDFVEAMTELMEERMTVYQTMMRNIYGIGTVLFRKFLLLQYAYTSFMVALVLGVSSFLIVFVWLAQK
jgi:hypothetical protein